MKTNTPLFRLYLFAAVLLAVGTVFFFRLMQLQIIDGASYAAMLTQGSTADQPLPAARGEILDRYGRPLAVNRIGFDLQLTRPSLPRGRENAIVLYLTDLLAQQGEARADSLPITAEPPYAYLTDGAVSPDALRAFLGLGDYASAADAMHWLTERYGLGDYTQAERRTVAAVRFDMERQGWNMSRPYTLADDISIETVSLIKQRSLDLPGVQVEETARRHYEDGAIAPHAVGRVGPLFAEEYERLQGEGYSLSDTIGKDGIELRFESELRGENGVRRFFLDASGAVERTEDVVMPVPGNSVSLTLDTELQRVTAASLESQIAYLQANAPAGQGREADAGTAAVVAVKTGEVLALVNVPSYDLATFAADYASLIAEDGGNPLFDRSLTGRYAPGSCFKPVVGLAGLNEGVITAASRVLCGGVYTLPSDPGHLFTCLSAHGSYTFREAIRESCNIFFYDTGRRVGIPAINRYAQELGLGVATGIELGETLGTQSVDAPDRPGDTLQTSIGQMGNAYSPLQLANYAATLANNGVRMRLSVIKRICSYNYEQLYYEHVPTVEARSTVADAHFELLRAGMVDASHIGTARGTFAGYPLQVASKTGTPQTLAFPNSVFIAYAPADDPEIAVAVIIEKGWHGYTGAPVAKAVFDSYFFGAASTEPEAVPGGLMP